MKKYEDSECIRKKYKYRRLILEGKIVLPHKEASLLLGPDCAYHLYSLRSSDGPPEKRPKKKKKRRGML
ncbi:MAG: hypothetical protein ABIL68_01890 [bacterium]